MGDYGDGIEGRSDFIFNSVTNDQNPSGWFDYETQIEAPYLDTTEEQLIEKVAQDGRRLLSLNEYIVASQDSKLLTGRYLDEGRYFNERKTSVRLGSHYKDNTIDDVICASFGESGFFNFSCGAGPNSHSPDQGGRSSGVKKA